MVIFRFSQEWAKKEYRERIRKLWQFVQTRPCKDLLVKVFFYKPLSDEDRSSFGKEWDYYKKINDENFAQGKKAYTCIDTDRMSREEYINSRPRTSRGNNGHYRNWVYVDTEEQKLAHEKGIWNIIQLKINPTSNDENIIRLMAHEFKHYLQYKKFNREERKGKHLQPDADKYAEKVVKKWKLLDP